MAKILVQHDISKQIVEIEEYQLAHPILGPHYKRVRVNENGKVYSLKPTDDDTDVPETNGESTETANTEKDEK